MAILRNVKHERFAQELANGNSAVKAHEFAGFSPNRANAGRLRHRDDIARRVAEILATRTKAVDKALMSAAERVGVNQEFVLRKLRRIATKAEREGDWAGANKALELLGRHLGTFQDRKNVDVTVHCEPGEYLRQLRERIGMIDVTPDDKVVQALQRSSAKLQVG
jgi:hypothetical protein